MKKSIIYFLLAIFPAILFSCSDDDNYNSLDGLKMVVRSVSVKDGASVQANMVSEITIEFNNLVGIDNGKNITLNDAAVEGAVSDKNHTMVILPVSLAPGTDYVLTVPAGAFYRSDDKSVAAEAFSISFSTAAGIEHNLISKTLVNPNASAEAVKVYNFLLENYGKKQLSGAMGEVAWGTQFCDFIAENAGAYPAIVGFDYIHLAASAPGSWIDYADITPVQKVWDAGSIPAVTWHWNVPVSQNTVIALYGGPDVAMPGDWSGNLQLTDDASKALLQDACVGAVITVHTKDVAVGAQGSVKNSSWGGLTDELGYFDITGDYSVTLDAAMAVEIKNNGFIISGHDYTVTGVDMELPAGGNMSYDASAENFKASNVLVEGTWENGVAKADVAKLAGYLALLRDANIPVLFRPFHEAAGDYTGGAWFWWGNSGTDTTIALWKWIRDTLTNDYGLNNLIWVWTCQLTDNYVPATPEKVRSAYPGDDVVDIVGTDLYEAALSDQSSSFKLVQEATLGHKIIALTETGNLLDPDAAVANDALWCFFMGWYEMPDGTPAFNEWNTAGEWATVMSNPLVINREQMPSLK